MISCTVTSSDKTDIYKSILGISLPSTLGEIQILPGHVESFFILKQGNIKFKQLDRQSKDIDIVGGECYVKNNRVVVIL